MHQGRHRRAEEHPGDGAERHPAPEQPASLGGGGFDKVAARTDVLTADGQSLREPQDDEERWCEEPGLGVSGEKSDEGSGHCHNEDGQPQGVCPPQPIADRSEEHASDGAH